MQNLLPQILKYFNRNDIFSLNLKEEEKNLSI